MPDPGYNQQAGSKLETILGKEQNEEKSRENMGRAGSRSNLFLLAEDYGNRDPVHIS